MIDFKHLHIGLTNRCRLQCIECARTATGGRFFNSLYDLDVEYFKQFLFKVQPEDILFCGNWGDPIYAKDFIGLVQFINENIKNCKITIHTNGSGKSSAWWEKLVSVLKRDDVLIFSIDGVPTNYTQYRKLSTWEDVEMAVTTSINTRDKLQTGVQIKWKYLVFGFNEHTIMDAYRLSKDMGFDDFFLQHAIVFEDMSLQTSRPFEDIKREFYEQKDRPLL